MAQLLIKGTKVAEVVGDTTSLIANTLYHPSGTQIITDDGGTIGLTNVNLQNINFDNVANDSISGDKIHGGTIGGSFLDGIKLNSSGNSITKSDGTTSVLSESGGVVTLAQDIVTGTSSYGFAQLDLTANEALGNITWDTITGDTTNFTKPLSNHLIQLGIAGIYIINASASMILSQDERNIGLELIDNSGPTFLAGGADQIAYLENTTSYGSVSITYTGYFSANSQIYFKTSGANQGNAIVAAATHASICLIRRTA